MIRFILALLLLKESCLAATYYVTTNGNNSADGSLATPWSNVWYAARNVVAGDTVNVGPGEFNEFVTNTVGGTFGNQITFQGTRGPLGEWLSIIDPSTIVSNGWISAPEIGTGVYKLTNSFKVEEMTIDHKRVAFTYTNGNMASSIANSYTDTSLSNGIQFLTLDSNYVVTNVNNGYLTNLFWDSVKAMFCVANTNTVYLRLRDGTNPNGRDIRVCGLTPAINVLSSNITLRNFDVRGAYATIFVNGSSPSHQVDNVIIESNYLANGAMRIQTYFAHDVTIRYNEITDDYYGYDNPGAWGGTDSSLVYRDRANLYVVSKFLMGVSSSLDYGIDVTYTMSNTWIYGNHIFKGLGTGIGLVGSANYTTRNLVISNNIIEQEPSIGISSLEFATEVYVYNNFISDCNDNFRFHHLDYGDTNRVLYIYRNRCLLPAGIGNHMEATFGTDGPVAYNPEFWVYHNSFSAGNRGLSIGIINADCDTLTIGGMRFLNNVFSGMNSYVGNIGICIWTNVATVGAFDYSELTPPLLTYPASTNAAWAGTNLVTSPVTEWDTNSVPDFKLRVGSPAINSALDLTQPFIIKGTNYPALPYGSEVKVGPAWDMGALEAGYVGNMTTLRVGTLRGP